jgi:O-antigen/teichoic acid export membrane protein
MAWLVGTLAAFVIGVIKLAMLNVLQLKIANLDIAWIRRGILVAFPFLVISAAQLTMDFSDRYLIDYFLGKSDVGVYSFFYGIANVPTTLITSVLVAGYYPKVINAYKFQDKIGQRHALIRKFLWQSIGLAISVCAIVISLIHVLLDFVEKRPLIDQINVFYLMLGQVILFSIQVVVQTILYARHEDRFLLVSAVTGALSNIFLNIFLIPNLGIIGAVMSTILSMGLMLGLRLFFIAYVRRAKNK